MPNVFERPVIAEPEASMVGEELMPLARAREALGESSDRTGVPILDYVRQQGRTVIVGAPGAGKSTFLEWFQLKLASATEEFVLGGRQAIPLLLRVRQLDPANLPTGSALIESATSSRDLASLMPDAWIHRQMSDGAILFMLDGLDEVDPQMRDSRILPWFE